MYIRRTLEGVIKKATREFPAVVLTLKKKIPKGFVVHSGDVVLPLGSNASALPFTDL